MKKGDAAELRSFEFSEWEIMAETDRIHLIIIYRTPYSEAHPVTTSVFLEELSTFLETLIYIWMWQTTPMQPECVAYSRVLA